MLYRPRRSRPLQNPAGMVDFHHCATLAVRFELPSYGHAVCCCGGPYRMCSGSCGIVETLLRSKRNGFWVRSGDVFAPDNSPPQTFLLNHIDATCSSLGAK